MAHAGVPVTMMDCDPNRSLTWWSTQGALPDRMRILSEVTEASIVKAVKVHDREGRLVVMDMEGVASRLVSRAISQADLVITPMRTIRQTAHGWTHHGAGGRHHPPPTARTGCLFGCSSGNLRTMPAQGNMEAAIDAAVRSGRPPSHRRHKMNDHESFAVDHARLRPREKDQRRSHKQTRRGTGTGSTLATSTAHVPAIHEVMPGSGGKRSETPGRSQGIEESSLQGAGASLSRDGRRRRSNSIPRQSRGL